MTTLTRFDGYSLFHRGAQALARAGAASGSSGAVRSMSRHSIVRRDAEIPAAVVDIARRRVRPLIRAAADLADRTNLQDLCASCYVQGLHDAQDVKTDRSSNAGLEPRGDRVGSEPLLGSGSRAEK